MSRVETERVRASSVIGLGERSGHVLIDETDLGAFFNMEAKISGRRR